MTDPSAEVARAFASKYLYKHTWDRPERYDTMMLYEVRDEVEEAFIAGWKACEDHARKALPGPSGDEDVRARIEAEKYARHRRTFLNVPYKDSFEAFMAGRQSLRAELDRVNAGVMRLGEMIVALTANEDCLKAQLARAEEAMRDSIARADDCGDSYNSQPIREYIAALEGKAE